MVGVSESLLITLAAIGLSCGLLGVGCWRGNVLDLPLLGNDDSDGEGIMAGDVADLERGLMERLEDDELTFVFEGVDGKRLNEGDGAGRVCATCGRGHSSSTC
jgi:hypothetical protein